MMIIDALSVFIGLAIILTLLGSIAIEGLKRRGSNEKKVIPAIDSKWRKITIAV